MKKCLAAPGRSSARKQALGCQ